MRMKFMRILPEMWALTGLDLHLEHCVGQQLAHHPFHANYVVFGHVKISDSFSVIKTICSK